MRSLALLVALLAQASQPTFKSGVNLVEVDVVVTNKAGQPVRGLTREDFEVLEDGKRVGIEAFTAIDLPAAPAGEKVASLDRSAVSMASNDQAEDGRVLLIVMDDYHVSFDAGRLVASKAIARRLVERMGPYDQAAVVTSSGRQGAQAEFTAEKARLIAAIDQFFPQSEVGAASGAARQSAGMARGGGFDFVQEIKARWAMDTLSNAAKALAMVPHRRKAVLLVSQGLPVSVEDIITNQSAAGAAQALRDFILTAQRSNIAVYPMDPCGLDLDDGCNTSSRDNLRSLADATGGFAVTNTNAPERSVDKMVAENGTYYLLGYSSPAANDGRRHRITVRTTVRDVEVRARDSYYAAKSAPKVVDTAPSVDALINAPLQTRGLTMRVAAVPAPLAQKPGSTVAVVVEMPSATALRAGSIDFSLVAIDTDGKIKARQRFSGKFTGKGNTPGGWVRLGSRVDVAEGRYLIRLAAVGADREIGSVFTEVVVPDFTDRLALGGLSLAVSSASTAKLAELLTNVLPLMPLATTEIPAGMEVVAQLPIRVNRGEGAVSIATSLKRGDGAAQSIGSATPQASDYAVPGGRVYSVPLPARLEPGSYRLNVEAVLGKERQSRELAFTVRQP